MKHKEFGWVMSRRCGSWLLAAGEQLAGRRWVSRAATTAGDTAWHQLVPFVNGPGPKQQAAGEQCWLPRRQVRISHSSPCKVRRRCPQRR